MKININEKINKNPRLKSRLLYLNAECEICNEDDLEKLTIHHIIPLYKKIIITRDNCKTVCYKCHRTLETIITLRENQNKKKLSWEKLKIETKKSLMSEVCEGTEPI